MIEGTGFKLDIPWEPWRKKKEALLQLRKKVGQEVWNLSLWTLNQLKQRTPRSSDASGAHLQDAWVRQKVTASGIIRMIVIRNTSPHAYVLNFLEWGTPPHTIEGSPLLVFKVGGQTIFTRKVQHPGTKPLRLFAIAEKTLYARMAELNQLVMAKMAELMGRK